MPFGSDLIILLIVISIGDGESTVSYNQPKFCPHAAWNPRGTTFASLFTVGMSPYGIFINTNNTIYVASRASNKILVWREGATSPTTVSPGHFEFPTSLFVTTNGNIYITNGYTDLNPRPYGRVDEWSSNTRTTVTVFNVPRFCTGLFVDLNNTLYCSMMDFHQVVKKSLNSDANTSAIAAGTGSSGSSSTKLDEPYGIFVDTNFDLYVADCNNNRIQRFQTGELNGTTVAGGNIAAETIELNCPTGIVLDAENYLFIVDGGKNRIVGSGSNGFRCLVGCSEKSGPASDHLHGPRTLSFDRSGNIYVTDRSNNRVQKFALASNSCALSYNQPQFCPTASWERNAVTFANITTIGKYLYGIFVDTINTVYVAARTLNQTQLWTEGSMVPSRIISENLVEPISLFVSVTGDIYVDNYWHGRVSRWAVNATNGVTVMYIDSFCFGLFIDVHNSLYCSIRDDHKIVKSSLNSDLNTTTTVAGTGSPSWGSDTLDSPHGIFVDTNFDLYVADTNNNRIQRFRSGELEGETVVTSKILIKNLRLNSPYSVVLDAAGYLFIVDGGNNRIVRSGPNDFRCVAGCDGEGSASHQLNNPRTLSFDSHGNMFVTDRDNHRIQKFVLKSNSCGQTTTTQKPSTSTSITKSSTSTIQSTSLTQLVSETDVTIAFHPEVTTTTTTIFETNSITKSFVLNLTSSITTTFEPTTTTTTVAKRSSEETTIGTTIVETISERSVKTESESYENTVIQTTKTLEITSGMITAEKTTTSEILTTKQPLESFVPPSCPNSTYIGLNCNISNDPCTLLKPCINGNCSNNATTPYGYFCSCPADFNGIHCEIDHRLCKPDMCRNGGTCNETLNATSPCLCAPGWEGIYCERKINFCLNVTCENNGVCRPLLLNYSCECLGDSYFGRHCEKTATRIIIYKIVSKSFAYVAIIAMASVAAFIVIMDILKYCFGIDPVHEERERMRRKKRAKKPKPRIIKRFVYVNAPTSSDIPPSTVEDTTV